MNELTVKNNLPAIESLPIKTVAELISIGNLIGTCGMFGCKLPEQGFVIASVCYQEKMSFIKFLETYHLVENRPSMKAEKMLSNLLRLGGTYKILHRTPEIASAEFEYKGIKYISTMTIKDAKLEKYFYANDGQPKSNWSTERKCMQMLWSRVTSDGVAVVCPLAHEFYTPEENEEFYEEDLLPANFNHPPIFNVKPEPVVEKPAAPVAEKTAPPPPAAPKVVEAELIDPKIIPVGDLKGQPWNALSIEQLNKLRNNKKIKAITPEHVKEIDAEIARQTAAKSEAANG